MGLGFVLRAVVMKRAEDRGLPPRDIVSRTNNTGLSLSPYLHMLYYMYSTVVGASNCLGGMVGLLKLSHSLFYYALELLPRRQASVIPRLW